MYYMALMHLYVLMGVNAKGSYLQLYSIALRLIRFHT